MVSIRPSDDQVLQLVYPSAPCRGSSMRGTLAEGDCLWIAEVPFDSLQVGDVVAFNSGGKIMAHRLAERTASVFLTQGDGNWRRDAAVLPPGGLIGKVMERERGGVRSLVVGGPHGRRRAAFLHGISLLRWIALASLAPAYRLVRASRVVSLVWRPRIFTVRFASRTGSITKFIHRGRTIAYWIPHAEEWACRKPYDLLLFPPVR